MPHTEPHIQAFTDKEAQQSLVHISFKHPTPRVTTPAEYLDNIRQSLFQIALNRRFFNIGRRPDPPFYAAQARCQIWPRSYLSLFIFVIQQITPDVRTKCSSSDACSDKPRFTNSHCRPSDRD